MAVETSGDKGAFMHHRHSLPEPEQQAASAVVDLTDRDITELQDIPLSPTSSCDATGHVDEARQETGENLPQRLAGGKAWHKRLDCAVKVPEAAARDHLANERTFLGWTRTSVAFALVGLVIDQLFRLEHPENPDPVLGFYKAGTPLAGIFISISLITIFLGASRFFKQQYAMERGRCHGASWEIFMLGGLTLAVLVVLLILVIAIDIRKDQT